jgi:hypothetical protein
VEGEITMIEFMEGNILICNKCSRRVWNTSREGAECKRDNCTGKLVKVYVSARSFDDYDAE